MRVENVERITWNTAQTAEAIGVTERHLQRLIARAEGPRAVRLGRRVVFLPETVRAWLLEKQESHVA